MPGSLGWHPIFCHPLFGAQNASSEALGWARLKGRSVSQAEPQPFPHTRQFCPTHLLSSMSLRPSSVKVRPLFPPGQVGVDPSLSLSCLQGARLPLISPDGI